MKPRVSGWLPIGSAANLNKLFETIHPRSEPPLTNEHVASAITAKSVIPIDAKDIQQLRDGRRSSHDEPSVHLRALAEFFGVPDVYLIDPQGQRAISFDSDITFLRLLRDSGLTPETICQLPESMRDRESVTKIALAAISANSQSNEEKRARLGKFRLRRSK